MNAADTATEVLISQEIESLAGCVSRNQTPESYIDIVYKLRAHVEKLSDERRVFWSEQVGALGVVLFPPSVPPQKRKGEK